MSIYAQIVREIKREERLSKKEGNRFTNDAYEKLQELIGMLPHGSGIDYDWEYELAKNGDLILKNGYTVYDEWGGRSGAIMFELRVKPSFDPCCYELKIKGRFSGKNEHYREYLYDVFYSE